MKKKLQIICVGLITINLQLLTHNSLSQNVGINADGANGDANTMLDIKGTDNTSSGFGLKIKDGSGTNKVVFRNDGNVGIGNSNPSYLLDVIDANNTGAEIIHVGPSGSIGSTIGNCTGAGYEPCFRGLGFDSNEAGLLLMGQTTASNDAGATPVLLLDSRRDDATVIQTRPLLGIANRNNMELLIDKDGNVGMGTTSPQNKLDVEGEAVIGITYSGSSTAPVNGLLVQGNMGLGTDAPRGKLHTYGQYSYFEGQVGGGGTLFTDTDPIPVQSSNGFIGYNGIVLMPKSWGNASTIDQHQVVYIGGAQRNNNFPSSALTFANWGYFTNTGTASGGLDNATARADAVKFRVDCTHLGGEFNHRLDFISRVASGNSSTSMSILSNGDIGIGTNAPGYLLELGGEIMLEDVAAPTASAGHSGIYSNAGELNALDAAGNSTVISPHHFELIEPSEEMAWAFYSKRGNQSINVDMTKLVRIVEKWSGEKLVHIKNESTGEVSTASLEKELTKEQLINKINELENQNENFKDQITKQERENKEVKARLKALEEKINNH